MASSGEISVLTELAHATCHSADRFAAATRACTDSYRGLVLEQCCDDRRRLVVDILRCLLLRGVPIPEARRAITLAPMASLMGVDVDVLWIDVEMAERKLHRAMSRALRNPALSEPVRELLSVHYLRLMLHHDELAEAAEHHSVAAGQAHVRLV